MKVLNVLLLAGVLWMLGFAAAGAWSPEGTPVCVDPEDQRVPRTVSLGGGETLVAWVDSRSLGTFGYEIRIQKLDAVGQIQWGPSGILVEGPDQNTGLFDLLEDGAGGAFLAFGRGDQRDLWLQRFDNDGSGMWGPDGLQITADPSVSVYWLQLAPDSLGGLVVAWDEDPDLANLTCKAQRVAPDGTVLWAGGGVPLTTLSYAIFGSRVAGDGGGGAYVTWMTGFAPHGILVQHFDDLGNRLWGDGICPHENTTVGQENPSVIPDATGGAIICWREATTKNVRGQRLDPVGNKRWGPLGARIPCEVDGHFTIQVIIAPDGQGGVLASWVDGRDTSYCDVYAQRLDSSGSELWTPGGVPVCTADNYQAYIDLAGDGAGGVVLAWVDERSGPARVYAQWLDDGGVPQWEADGRPASDISIPTNGQYWPSIAAAAVGADPVVVWSDQRVDYDDDLYANLMALQSIPREPDPLRCGLAPWYALGYAFVSPGAQSSVDTLGVTIVDQNGLPLFGAVVEVVFGGDCTHLCIDPADDGLMGVTDQDGHVVLNPRVGGCDACTVEVYANGFLIRTFTEISSTDWDGFFADGVVDADDQDRLMDAFGGGDLCSDFDGDGLVGILDLGILGEAMDVDANSVPCSQDPPVPSCTRASTFESPDHGWTPLDPAQVTLTWMESGGHPGGYLETYDVTTGSAVVLAPPVYAGDWRPLEDLGVVHWDQNVIYGGGETHPITSHPQVIIQGPGGTARHLEPGLPPEGLWESFAVPVSAGAWEVTAGTWADLLAEVSQVLFDAEVSTGHERIGLDDFYVGVPEDPAHDCNGNAIPDSCDTDLDGNGHPDDCILSAVGPAPARVRTVEVGCAPNPFNPATVIRYRLADPGPARVAVYDLAGRQIAELVARRPHQAGSHEVTWRGADDRGRRVPSGIYLGRVEALGGAAVVKLALIE